MMFLVPWTGCGGRMMTGSLSEKIWVSMGTTGMALRTDGTMRIGASTGTKGFDGEANSGLPLGGVDCRAWVRPAGPSIIARRPGLADPRTAWSGYALS